MTTSTTPLIACPIRTTSIDGRLIPGRHAAEVYLDGLRLWGSQSLLGPLGSGRYGRRSSTIEDQAGAGPSAVNCKTAPSNRSFPSIATALRLLSRRKALHTGCHEARETEQCETILTCFDRKANPGPWRARSAIVAWSRIHYDLQLTANHFLDLTGVRCHSETKLESPIKRPPVERQPRFPGSITTGAGSSTGRGEHRVGCSLLLTRCP
jgi:hypothetical protein